MGKRTSPCVLLPTTLVSRGQEDQSKEVQCDKGSGAAKRREQGIRSMDVR